MSARARLEERAAQARLDLEDVARQRDAGELDEATAARLEATYRRELDEAAAELDRLDDQPPQPEAAPGRSRRRLIVGLVAMLAVAGAIAFVAARSLEDRPPGGFVTGNLEGGRDLAEVSNEELEQVVAENPDIVPMRLALARRYFEETDFSSALPHYLAVLERDPRNQEALANLGWMTYVSGNAETGAAYLERSLAAGDDYPLAALFLASVRLYGLDQPQEAVVLLEELLASGQVPDDVAADVEGMLAEARARAEAG